MRYRRSRVLKLLKRVALDVTPMRHSRDFRLMVSGQLFSALGTQAALVALPFQIYKSSGSAALVGLLGAFELGPMIVVSLLGGALADRLDRRMLLAVAQVGVIAVAALLFVLSLLAHPSVWVVLVLGGILAGCTALDGVSRGAIVPTVLGAEHLRSGLALNYGLQQATGIVGPGLGGILIGIFGGVAWIYGIDAASCIGMFTAALMISPQRPLGHGQAVPIKEAIAEGLHFVAYDKALAGSFVIDINAMLFGMPKALFAVLSLSVYHAGASGTGLLYAAIAVGGTLSVLTSGWVQEAHRLGRIVIACVLLWGLAIVGAGLVRSIWPAFALLAAAGWADGISAVCRSTISQTLTPDHMRGRMSAVFSLVVTSGPRLGDLESGLVAGLAGALNSVVIGGAACLVGVGACLVAFPELARYDAHEALERMRAEERRVSDNELSGAMADA
jgi:MFS family permease